VLPYDEYSYSSDYFSTNLEQKETGFDWTISVSSIMQCSANLIGPDDSNAALNSAIAYANLMYQAGQEEGFQQF
jgi:hypothetical protein